MIRELVLQRQPVILRNHSLAQNINIEANEILRVLEKAAKDNRFIARLTEQGYKALKTFHLSNAAKAALLSGDIRWIEARVGKLNPPLRTWIDCRLQQEIW